jgi:hypothetical protein
MEQAIKPYTKNKKTKKTSDARTYEHQIKGMAGFSKMQQRPTLRKQQQHLSCRTSVIALPGVESGHHDLQTLHHLTSFRGDEESKAKNQEPGGP